MIGDDYGIRWMTNYLLSDDPPGEGDTDRLLKSMLPEARDLGAGAHGFDYAHVGQFDGMLIEPPRFLRAMLRDVQIAGGRIVVRDFHDPAEIAALPEGLIFNCTGLGAAQLFGDAELVPMRGQLAVLLPQPEIDYAIETDSGMYMFSRSDGVILGGTADRGDCFAGRRSRDDPAADRAPHRHRAAASLCLIAVRGAPISLSPDFESFMNDAPHPQSHRRRARRSTSSASATPSARSRSRCATAGAASSSAPICATR